MLDIQDLVALSAVSTHFNKYITAHLQPSTESKSQIMQKLVSLLKQIVDDDSFQFPAKSALKHTCNSLLDLASDSKEEVVRSSMSQIDLLLMHLEQPLIKLFNSIQTVTLQAIDAAKEAEDKADPYAHNYSLELAPDAFGKNCLAELESIPKSAKLFIAFNALLAKHAITLHHSISPQLVVMLEDLRKLFESAFIYWFRHFKKDPAQSSQALQILMNLKVDIDKKYFHIMPHMYKQRGDARYYRYSNFNALGLAVFNQFHDLAKLLVFNGAKLDKGSELTYGLLKEQGNPWDGSYSPLEIALAKKSKPMAWLLFKKSQHDVDFILLFMRFNPQFLHVLLPRFSRTITQADFEKIWNRVLSVNTVEVAQIVNQYLPASTPSRNPQWSIISNIRTTRWLGWDSPLFEFLLEKNAPFQFEDFAYAVDVLHVQWVKLFIQHGAHQLPRSGPLINLLDSAVKRYRIDKNATFSFFFERTPDEKRYDEIVKMLKAVDSFPQAEPAEAKGNGLGLSRIF